MKFSGKARIVLGSVLFLAFILISCGFMKINNRVLGVSPSQTGIIRVYDFSTGEQGDLLAETSLEKGSFEFAINPDQKIFIVKLTDFTTYDIFNDFQFTSNQGAEWKALIAYPKYKNQRAQINLNPITTIASAFAEFKIKQTRPSHPEDIIFIANEIIGKHFGDIDPIYDIPSSLDTRSIALTNDIKYSLLLLSFYEIGYHRLLKNTSDEMDSNPYTILNMVRSLHDDIIYDGVLNSIGPNGNTNFYGEDISQIFKSELASSIYRIAQNTSINKTGLVYADLHDFLNQISTSRAEIFESFAPVYPFDIDPPIINCLKPLNGTSVSGLFEINCQITDSNPGIERTEATINDSRILNDLDLPSAFFAIIDSRDIQESFALIKITSEDKIGNESNEFISVTINN